MHPDYAADFSPEAFNEFIDALFSDLAITGESASATSSDQESDECRIHVRFHDVRCPGTSSSELAIANTR
jgi:hypothetical protein